ncbi:hypothetical protein ACI782_03270 [Geodermatophilus sp. SYSU D00703]
MGRSLLPWLATAGRLLLGGVFVVALLLVALGLARRPRSRLALGGGPGPVLRGEGAQRVR